MSGKPELGSRLGVERRGSRRAAPTALRQPVPVTALVSRAATALVSCLRNARNKLGVSRVVYAAIKHYLALTNGQAKPFVWTKTADDILASVARYRIPGTGH